MSTLDCFEENLKSICKQYVKNEGNSGKYDLLVSEENYPKFQNLLKQNGMTFVVRDSDMYRHIKKRLLWSSSVVSFFKTPFYIEKTASLHCTNGPKYFDRTKKIVTPILQDSNSTGNLTSDKDEKSPTRKRKSSSKKVGCGASMRMVILKTFPEYCIKNVDKSKKEKQLLMKLLKDKLKSDPTSVVAETLYQISFSTAAGHCHPIWTSFKAQCIDPALKKEIRNLVESGITNVQTIKALLCKWVKENIGDVNDSSRAYWPTKKTIRNHIQKYAPRTPEIKQRNKQEKAVSKTKIKHRRKRRFKNNDCCQSDDMLPQPKVGMSFPSPAILEMECDESFYQSQPNYLPTETSLSVEQSVPVSGIRDLIRTIYDRSLLLPDDCSDPILYSKLQDVVNFMNIFIERDQIQNVNP